MAVRPRYLIALSICFACGFMTAEAQNGEKPSVAFEFTVYSPSAPSDLGFKEWDDPAFNLRLIKLNRAELSPVYQYRGDERVHFYRVGAPQQSVASVKVPPTIKRFLFLLLPRKQDASQPYSIIAVDDGVGILPKGSFAVLNVSGRSFRADFGGRSFAAPQGMSTAQFGGTQGYLKFKLEGVSGEVAVGGVNLSVGNDERILVLLLPPYRPTGLQPLIRILRE